MKPKSKQKVGSFLNRYNYYSIRKFTIGTASILLGSTLIFGISNEAQAQSEDGAHTSEQQTTETSSPTAQPDEVITNETIKDNKNVQGDSEPSTQTSKEKATTEPTPDSTSTKSSPSNKDSIQTPTVTNTTQTDNNKNVVTEDKENVNKHEKTTNQNFSKNEEQATPNSTETTTDEKTTTNEETSTTTNNEKDLNESRAISTRSATREASDNTTTTSTREMSEDSADEIEVPQEFVDRYNNASDKSQLVHDLLSDSYDSNDVEEILKRADIDYTSTDAKEVFSDYNVCRSTIC